MRISLRKIDNKKGFSIAELLVAILILSMVSIVVAGGIPVARDAYYKITVSANAQVMLSTTISSLRNEIGTASAFYLETGLPGIVYRSGKNGNISRIYKNVEKQIMIWDYYDPKESEEKQKTKPRLLVPETDDLYVTFENIIPPSFNGDIVSVSELIVKNKEDENAPSVNEPIDLSIRGFGKAENYVSPSSAGGSGTGTGTGTGSGTGSGEGTGNTKPEGSASGTGGGT